MVTYAPEQLQPSLEKFPNQIAEGDSVPEVVFKARVRDESIGGSNPFTWKDVSSSDLFKGKRSVIFALPGGKLKLTR